MKEKGNEVDQEKILQEVKVRDAKDFNRKAGPLKKADDAIVIDSTHNSIEETVNEVLKFIKSNG